MTDRGRQSAGTKIPAHAGLRESRLRTLIRLWLKAGHGLSVTGAAATDFAIRLWLAQALFTAGAMQAMMPREALGASAHLLPAALGDHVGPAIALSGAVLLGAGLFTRLAAIPLLVMALTAQSGNGALDANLFLAALSGWYIVIGAGPVSLDARIEHGLSASALPLAARAMRAGAALRRWGGPAYQLALRLWLAAALLGVGLPERFFPVMTADDVPRQMAILCAALLGLGLAAPVASAVLIASLLGEKMMGHAPSQSLFAVAVLALAGLFGAGPLSLAGLIVRLLTKARPIEDHRARIASWPHVVIVGAGFGGLACAIKLRFLPLRITLIDRNNFHLFQPLLYQVAAGGLSPGDIATPIRGVFRDDPNVEVLRATVTDIDTAAETVVLETGRIGYDYLVVATGASHSYFGQERWARAAPGLKRLEDATAIRGRILEAFERAEATDDDAERQRLLTFLIVGGGATGVELAGAVAELAHRGLDKEFRKFDPAQARVILVQSGPCILPAFPARLSDIARRSLEMLGVEVRLASRVTMIDDQGVTIGDTLVPTATVLWAAGVVASPAARWLKAEADQAGRIKVAADLSAPGLPNVFALGDTAASLAWAGNPVPGLAPAAKQGGEYVAAVIRARLLGGRAPPPFRYRHQGNLATIGRKSAVADFGWISLSGAVAWWLWGFVHVYFLVGLRNRLAVMFNWFWAYITYRVGAGLITGAPDRPAE